MNKMPHHIKIMYILMLKQGLTAIEVMSDKNGMLYDCAVEVCGGWEGYSQAIAARNKVSDFIRKYMILPQFCSSAPENLFINDYGNIE